MEVIGRGWLAFRSATTVRRDRQIAAEAPDRQKGQGLPDEGTEGTVSHSERRLPRGRRFAGLTARYEN